MSEMMKKAPMAIASEPTTVNLTGAWRFEEPVFVERIGPCTEACPVGEDIPAIMALNSRGDFEKAYHKIRQENPLPGICGRLCYHPCETVCNRRRFDEAVSVRDLEWFVCNLARKHNLSPESPRSNTNRKVAVVSGGLAGLSCAYFLAHLGYRVTILEREAHLEGMSWLARPENGLTMDFVKWEVAQVLALGIDIRTNATLGSGLYQKLGREFEAVYISSGALHGTIDSETRKTTSKVYLAQDLLRRVKSNNAPALSGQVVIVGGGTRALEAAQAVKAIGCHPIIVYSSTFKDAHAIANEAVQAKKEGIQFLFQTGVLGLVEESGQVKGLMCSKMESGDTDKTSEYGTQLSPGAPFEVQANQVIIALGRKGNLNFVPASIQESGLVVIHEDRGLVTATELSEKKAIDSSRTIVREIASGKSAALILDLHFRHIPFDMIERFAIGRLKGLSMEAYRRELEEGLATRSMTQVVRFEELNLAYFEKTSRVIPSFISNTFSKQQALISARRCFNCGTCTFCYKCYDFCPDLAIHMDSDAKYREIDYDHCKGCGICVEECPRGAISWARD